MGYNAVFSQGLRDLDALAGDRDDWFPADREPALRISAATTSCRRIVFSTKSHWLEWILPCGTVPADVTIIQRFGMLSTAYAQRIRREVAVAGCPLHFVGDLDPHDLMVFMSLRVGGIDGETSDEPSLDVTYLGVSDPWMALCERHREPSIRDRPRSVMIPLTPFEQAALWWLEHQDVDWDAVVGGGAMALLRSGWKLELEGASNPGLHDADFPGVLRAYLLGEPAEGR